ncbi:LysE family translocator [Marinivivus vitaminiproducens]|uniref:LysE family translocator n=1 Tax=Marinivivus vitaminiproducens TaxID=3035935 RepID=UPI00279BAB83|nr:LysE family transporter [Geminicoccaceae bacterium SCSIO 64248]
MSLELYLAFVLTSAMLALIPGPNVALIVANSIAHGVRFGLLTVAGTSVAMAAQLGLTALGTQALMIALSGWFEMLRWAGVAYLIWLGIRAWRAPAADLAATRPQARQTGRLLLKAFLVALTNPKTLLFYGAFLPQFITPATDPGPQLALLAVTFLAVAGTIDSLWAILAARARVALARHGRLRNRLTGSLLIGSGTGLALARPSG